jgi:hypothetical protein
VGESLKDYLAIERRYPGVLKGAKYCLFHEGRALSLPEKLEEVTLLHCKLALGAVEVIW